jgi:putative aldouronate transport system permease protein
MSENIMQTRVKTVKYREMNVIPNYANVILHILLILGSAACVLPLLMIVSASLTQSKTLELSGYAFWPRDFTLTAYNYLFRLGSFVGLAYRNTLIATVAGTVICVTTVGLYAYPLSRKDCRFNGFFTFISFFTMLFGGGLVPFYILCTQFLRISDTMLALFLPAGFSPFWVIVMRTFYRTNVPDEIVESARIDGASEWRTLFQIVMPLAVPGLATVALFSTIGLWNNFFYCLLLIKDQKLYTLQYMIFSMLQNIQFLKMAAANMGVTHASDALASLPAESFRMAMAVVTIGPIIAAYPFFQRYYMKGLTIGALKG